MLDIHARMLLLASQIHMPHPADTSYRKFGGQRHEERVRLKAVPRKGERG